MSIAEKLTTIAENQQAVYEAGKNKAIYDWWDAFQTMYRGQAYATDQTNYMYAFAGVCWGDDNYNPIRTLKPTGNAQNMYAYSNITDTKVPIDLTGTVTNCAYMFAYATKLKTVRLLKIQDTTPMSSHFTDCTKLENLTIEGTIGRIINLGQCPLTRASIENVIGNLSDTATVDTVNGKELTATFKTSAVNNAFTTDEWNAIVASKPNWKFVLA